MAADPKYDMAVYPVQVAVRSETDGARAYMVTLPYCPCADFTNRKGKVTGDSEAVTICKHLIKALDLVAGWHRTPAPGAVTRTAYTVPDQVAARELLTRTDLGNLTVHDADAVLRAAKGHPGLAAESEPGDGTGVRVTDYLGAWEVSILDGRRSNLVPRPQVHHDLTRAQAFGFLVDETGGDATVGQANTVLRQVREGVPSFVPAEGGRPCVKVEVAGRTVKDRRYTITVPG